MSRDQEEERVKAPLKKQHEMSQSSMRKLLKVYVTWHNLSMKVKKLKLTKRQRAEGHAHHAPNDNDDDNGNNNTVEISCGHSDEKDAKGVENENENESEAGAESEPYQCILQNLNGAAKPGEIVAVIGPSGSGKSSFLNCIGGRVAEGVTGDIRFNGIQRPQCMGRFTGYVMQGVVMCTIIYS